MRTLAVSTLVMAAFLGGCDNEGTITTVLDGAGEQPPMWIYDGSAPDEWYHDSTVAIHELSGSSVYVLPYCSGTLIRNGSETWVMTAAHCLDEASYYANNYNTMEPNELAVYVGQDPDADILDHLYLAQQVIIHSSYDRWDIDFDFGLIELYGPVTEDVSAIPELPPSLALTSADAGVAMDVAGFGEVENGSYGVLLQTEIEYGGPGCQHPQCYAGVNPNTQWWFSMEGGNGSCFGDSGGPTFLDRNGTIYLAGITSWGDPNCQVYGVNSAPHAANGWITSLAGDPDVSCDDTDGDGVCDESDPCPLDNPDDTDGDGICDSDDACPLDNPDDTDGDGICDSDDPCPLDNPDDSDGDGSCDSDDLCPGFDDSVDTDGDGVPDGCDACPGGTDSDGDGVCDSADPCPNDNPDDSDGDGSCDSADLCPGYDDGIDTDGDGTPDGCDNCPLDNPDDSDGDGTCDSDDICPGGDDSDDADGDGVPDACDLCPLDFNDDSDGDGTCDSADICPGGDDTVDSDSDGVPDDCDACPTEAGEDDGCPSTCDYTGTVSSSNRSDYFTIGSLSSGTNVHGDLEWSPTSANLDLYLQRYSSGRWRTVRSSRTSGFESIDYTVPGNYNGQTFRWRVRRRSGTADYCLSDNQ